MPFLAEGIVQALAPCVAIFLSILLATHGARAAARRR
jgi:hypothetical protein